MPDPLLRIRDLSVRRGDHVLVDGVDLDLDRGAGLGIVGESGSGKSLTCRSVLGILPPELTTGPGSSIRFDGTELTTLSSSGWLRHRGDRIGAVFQDPGSYLNPSITVGRQLAEVLRVRGGLRRREARLDAIERFAAIGLRDPALVHDSYPFELSGGMLQRVLIAVAICRDPDLLIADEATTALDVTVQAEVLDLLADLRARTGLALVLVSHDLAVVAQVCEQVAVLRDGRLVERGPTEQVLRAPAHPYTRSLIEAHSRYGIERFRPRV